MRYGKLSGLALGLGLLLAACGGKEEAKTNEEALKKAAEIQKGIEDYLVVTEGPADTRVLSHEKVTVSLPESGDFYLVTIDGVRIGRKDADFLQVGQVGYKLVAKDAKTYLASDLKMAGEMPFMGRDGKQSGILKLTPGQLSAEWSSELHTFLAMDFQATDIQASDTAASGGDLRAKAMSWKQAGTDKGGGVSDLIGTFSLDGFTAKDTSGGGVSMDKLMAKMAVADVKMAVYMEQAKKLQAVMAKVSAIAEADAKAAAAGSGTGEQPATPTPATPTTPAQLSDADQALLADYVNSIPKMFSGFSYDINVTGLSATEAGGKVPFTLASSGLTFGVSGVDKEKARVDLGLSHDGLVLTNPVFNDPMIKAVLPKSGNLAVSLTDIPTQKLLDAIAKALPSLLTSDPAMAEAGAFIAFGGIQQVLQQSDVKLKVNPSGWTGEVTTLKANGDFIVNPQSVNGAVGTLNLALTGLDDLIKLATDPATQSPDAGQMIGMLQMLQGMAKRETGSDGKPVDNYKIDVKPTGETTVNDQPLPF